MKSDLDAERVTLGQVAKMARVHITTAWRWTLTGVGKRKLRSIRIGGRRWVLRQDLDAFLAEKASSAEVQPPKQDADIDEQLRKAGLRPDERAPGSAEDQPT